MTIRETTDKVAVIDTEYFWQPMDICPQYRKVQLLTTGGVAVYGSYDGRNKSWVAWAPLPKIPKEMKV
jgi:hypothetical protein